MPGGAASVRELSIQSDYMSLETVAEFVEKAALEAGAGPSDCIDFVMSVTEAVNNAIQHGNHENPDRKVNIRIEIATRRLTVWVRDEGVGFDPDRLPDPTDARNLLRESGRGILMMKAFMDQVDFVPWERGMAVKMVKSLSLNPES